MIARNGVLRQIIIMADICCYLVYQLHIAKSNDN